MLFRKYWSTVFAISDLICWLFVALLASGLFLVFFKIVSCLCQNPKIESPVGNYFVSVRLQ